MSSGKAEIDLLSKSRKIENIAQGLCFVSHSVAVQISPFKAPLFLPGVCNLCCLTTAGRMLYTGSFKRYNAWTRCVLQRGLFYVSYFFHRLNFLWNLQVTGFVVGCALLVTTEYKGTVPHWEHIARNIRSPFFKSRLRMSSDKDIIKTPKGTVLNHSDVIQTISNREDSVVKPVVSVPTLHSISFPVLLSPLDFPGPGTSHLCPLPHNPHRLAT